MQHLITTKPTCTPCPRCGRLELTGHDEGLPYRADPAPLTVRAELAARLNGRRSWALVTGQLAFRSPSRIQGDTRHRPPVFAEHRCEQPPAAGDIDTPHLATVTRLIERATPKPDQPPPVTDTEFDALFLLGRELDATIIGHTYEEVPY